MYKDMAVRGLSEEKHLPEKPEKLLLTPGVHSRRRELTSASVLSSSLHTCMNPGMCTSLIDANMCVCVCVCTHTSYIYRVIIVNMFQKNKEVIRTGGSWLSQ